VMDGHFVPNITFGPPLVRAVRKVATVPLDVHLMIEDPDRYIEEFADAGAERISVHVEVLPHLHRTVELIKSLGVQASVAINPATPVVALEAIAADLDQVLVMSVNPGFGGQKFIPSSLDKLRRLRNLIRMKSSPARIEIDGGVGLNNVAEVVTAGAEILVAGSAVFGAENPAEALKELLRAAESVGRVTA
jgi:ribulose-phosphate 3-epimerase